MKVKNIKIKILKIFKKMSKRNIIIILLIGLILVGLTFYLRNEIATFVAGPELTLPPQPAFYFSPPSGEAMPGESFNVDLMLNTEGLNISAVSSYIKYDPQKVLVQNVDRTNSVFGYEVESSFNNAEGVIKITAGQPGDGISNDIDDGFTGDKGRIATISLKIPQTANGVAMLNFIRGLNDAPSIANCKVQSSQGQDVFVCSSRMILDDGLGTDKLAAVNDAVYTIKPPTVPDYNLNITKGGNGNGTITSSPAGILCGSKCDQRYQSNTLVTLFAEPDFNSVFNSWGGDSDCSDGIVTVDKDKSCTVIFDPKPPTPPNTYTLNIIKTGDGVITSEPSGIDCGSDCIEVYESGVIVKLNAKTDSNWKFIGWQGVPDCDDGSVTMDSDKTCTAQFGPVELPVPSPQDNRIKIKLELEGKKDRALAITLEIKYKLSGELIKTYTAVNVATDGSVEIDASDLGKDTYNVKLVVPGYLTHTLGDIVLPDNLVVFTPSKFIAGNLFDKDNTINELDWSVMNRKWGTNDVKADINQDGMVNELDWSFLNRNWAKNGD